MKSLEFAYWLQGSLELTELDSFNATQTQMIKNHLAMVNYAEKDKPSQFCAWLQGFFDMVEPRVIDFDQTEKIKTKLNACFTHVVENKAKTTSGFEGSLPGAGGPRLEAMC